MTADSFTRIYDLHYPQVFRYVLARTRSRHEAEELTAEVFALALAGLRRRGAPLHLAGWLIGIASHVVSRFWRIRSLESPPPASDDVQDDPEELVLGRLDGEIVWRCVDALSAEHRQVVLLRIVAGLNARKVGGIMGKSAQAVRSLQWRALAALRRRWMEAQVDGRVSRAERP